MQNLDSKQNRFILISIIICILFSIAIIKAFQYIPAKTIEFNYSEPTVDIKVNDDYEDSLQATQDSKEDLDIIPIETAKTKKAIMKFDSIGNNEIEEKQENIGHSPYNLGLQKAKEYIINKDLNSALKEYTNTIDLANNSEEKALCYEEISKIYAAKNDYLSAHTYAQLAFNEKPNSNREVLLARIYYKTGQKDKATVRINNVLNRGFNQEY